MSTLELNHRMDQLQLARSHIFLELTPFNKVD